MTDPASSPRPIWPFIVGALALGVAVVGFLLIRDLIAYNRPAPEFPSLAESPDPSLHGTVAYFAATYDEATNTEGGCVRVVAASGAFSKDVLCLASEGFDTGPELAFLPDGRLQVTMFHWPTDQPLVVGWQKVVDVVTGEVEEVPAEGLPSAPFALEPSVGPAGETIRSSVGGGHAEVVLTDAGGNPRTLMSATVSPDYQLRVMWGAPGDWILAEDGRLLVTTAGDPPQTRVLVAEPGVLGSPGSTDPRMVTFGATALDLLADEG